MTTTTQPQQVFESRWGFHPVSREDCLKLKEAHKLLLRAYRDVKRNIRWNHKEPQNQKGPEPKAPKDFIESGYHQLDKKTFYGPGFRKYKGKNLYLHVLHQYQKARRPAPNPHAVEPLDLPADLDKIVAELRKFYAE